MNIPKFVKDMRTIAGEINDILDATCDVINRVEGDGKTTKTATPTESGYTLAYYIVTNTTGIGEYTPSVFMTLEESVEWLKECSIRNFIAEYAGTNPRIEFEGRMVGEENRDEYKYLKSHNLINKFISEVINKWEHGDGDCNISNYNSVISCKDGTFNQMQIYIVMKSETGNPPIKVSPVGGRHRWSI